MLKLTSADLKRAKPDALVIPVCEDDEIHTDDALLELIARARKLEEFSGEKDDEVILHAPAGMGAKRCLFLGLGKAAAVDGEALRALAGRGVGLSIRMGLSRLLFAVPAFGSLNLDKRDLVTALFEGAALGNHLFDRYKKEKKHRPLNRLSFQVSRAAARQMADLPGRVEAVCAGTVMARDWVSTPANDKRPERFARDLAAAASKAKLNTRVLDEKELKKKKFGAILAVGQGSRSRPRMVVMEHRPKGAKKTVALVGKGVTFDTGGINLKPTGSIGHMKVDMSGAAAVAATLVTAARLNISTAVVGLIPVVENMPSGGAIRPGDVITTFAGKTVEIGNTDAEGRLILADAMAYAQKTYAPDILIDLATLTGACVVALGDKIAGVFSPDDHLAEAILAAGGKTHERCWRLPLPEDYRQLLKSEIADINNMSSSRWGGAISAALFLSEFVSDTRWAHIDIAGPAFTKNAAPYCPPGGTGFGVRLLCELIGTI
jgi:leucyl aminopeptidase